MKKYIFILLLCACLLPISAKSNLQALASSVAYRLDDLPKEEQMSRGTSKIIYRDTVKTVEDLKNERPYLLSECVRNHIESTGTVSESDILSMLNSEEEFILLSYFPMGTERASYRKIGRGSQNIGEFAFGGANDGLLVSGGFTYDLKFLDGEELNEFWIGTTLTADDMDTLRNVPEIFYKEDGMWKWKNADSRRELFELMQSHNTRLPAAFLRLQEAWEKIIRCLEVDGEKITF